MLMPEDYLVDNQLFIKNNLQNKALLSVHFRTNLCGNGRSQKQSDGKISAASATLILFFTHGIWK